MRKNGCIKDTQEVCFAEYPLALMPVIICYDANPDAGDKKSEPYEGLA
jgi:hypothetical protein